MAPTCADPRQVVIALEPDQRRELFNLVREIIAHMMTTVQPSTQEDYGSVETDDEPEDEERKPFKGGQDNPNESAPAPKKKAKNAVANDNEGYEISTEAALHLNEWKNEFLPRLEEILKVKDDSKIVGERKKRKEDMQKRALDTPEHGEDLISFGDAKVKRSEDIEHLQALYHPIPNQLNALPGLDRREILSSILLLLLFTGKYSAHSRALALYLASALELPSVFVDQEEMEIARELIENGTKSDKEKEKQGMNAEKEAEKRREGNKVTRFWKVGLASVAGAAVIGVTGGLAAPLVAGAIGGIMGGVGLGGVASFLGIFWMNGALVGALFGAYGAKMTGEMMDKYAKEVEDFRFLPLTNEYGPEFTSSSPSEPSPSDRRLRVTIGINGWLNTPDDVTKPWRVLPHDTEVFALRYEMAALLELGTALRDLISSAAWKTLKSEIIKRTVLATLWAALWPVKMMMAATSVDNPFSRASNRSKKAGRLLADALINKVQGERPVTLVGYSLGATAIHACLQELSKRRAFGLVESVVLIGCPAPSSTTHWRTLRSVVSGRIFNVYSENDMMLGFVYRMHSLDLGVAGLQPIEGIEGVVNIDLSDRVSGHLRYPEIIGEILKKCGFVGVKADAEIEKDDVIIMKDQHAEGKLVDFEGQEEEKPKMERNDSSVSKSADELRGLNISPPALENPSSSPSKDEGKGPALPQRPSQVVEEEKGPALPQRPTQEAEAGPPLPNRPSAHEAPDMPTRKPVEYREEVKRRPLTPTSNDEDDQEYRTITMQDNESGEDEHKAKA